MTVADVPPAVPDDAPPAVLFRLSYRTNECYRSGFRGEDDDERVVQSMRGWWEIDPRDLERLEIEYAVAFHRGVTRAVAKIDRWKWLEIEGDGHHREPVDDLGNPIGTCVWPQQAGIRWAFDVVPGGVERAVWNQWIGDGGKRMPDRLYHTITSYWPASPADSSHDLLGKALQLLGEGLRPLIARIFAEPDDEDWLETLRRKHRILAAHRGPVSPDDPYVSLELLINEWRAVSRLFSHVTPDFLKEIVYDRHRWAHFDGATTGEDVHAAVEDMIILLQEAGARAEATRADSIRRALELKIEPSA